MSKIKRMLTVLSMIGMNIPKLLVSAKRIPWFISQRKEYLKQLNKQNMNVKVGVFPCLHDAGDFAGSVGGHYFWQDLWVAQKIFRNSPNRHVDVGSRLDGFVTHVASFRNIEVLDIRPLDRAIANVTFLQADLMNKETGLVEMADSVSCLHVIEHFGLGRYGDPISPNGHIVGLRNIAALVARGGTLYLSFPTGQPRVEFNAHRVLDLSEILSELPEFSFQEGLLVDDSDATKEFERHDFDELKNTANRQTYGCVVLALQKNGG